MLELELKDLVAHRPDNLIKENMFLRKENEKLKEEVHNLLTRQHRVNNIKVDHNKENNLKE